MSTRPADSHSEIPGMVHDLNNSLTAVMGYAQLILQSSDLPESSKADFHALCAETKRCHHLVQNLRTAICTNGLDHEPLLKK